MNKHRKVLMGLCILFPSLVLAIGSDPFLGEPPAELDKILDSSSGGAREASKNGQNNNSSKPEQGQASGATQDASRASSKVKAESPAESKTSPETVNSGSEQSNDAPKPNRNRVEPKKQDEVKSNDGYIRGY